MAFPVKCLLASRQFTMNCHASFSQADNSHKIILADDSHELSRLVFYDKIKTNIECRLQQIFCLALLFMKNMHLSPVYRKADT